MKSLLLVLKTLSKFNMIELTEGYVTLHNTRDYWGVHILIPVEAVPFVGYAKGNKKADFIGDVTYETLVKVTDMVSTAEIVRLFNHCENWESRSATEFVKLYEAIAHAAATEDRRPVLTGMNYGVTITGKQVGACVDGYVLAMSQDYNHADNCRLLSVSGLSEVVKLFKKFKTQSFEFSTYGNMAFFKTPEFVGVVPQISGTYPDVDSRRGRLSIDLDGGTIIATKDLKVNILDAAKTFKSSQHLRTLKFTPVGEGAYEVILLRSEAPREPINLGLFAGCSIDSDVTFDLVYVADVLNRIPDVSIMEIDLYKTDTGEMKPILLRVKTSDFIYVVMCMTVEK